MNERSAIRFSVIVPARNEEDFVQATVESVKSQDIKTPFEIIVVDNGSVDKTSAIAGAVGAKVVYESRPGLPQARETGRQAASGDYLIYIDADTLMPPNYLSKLDAEIRRHPELVGISNPFRFYDGNALQNLIIYAYFKVFYRLQTLMLWVLGGSNQLIGGSFAVNARILEKAGGFNTDIKFFGEDTEISKRLGRFGKISFLHNTFVETSARRFKINGTMATTFVYIRNYFSVALFNHEATHQTGRFWMKAITVISAILLIERYIFHYTHFILVKAHTHNLSYWAALATQHEFILTAVLLFMLALALSALISPAFMLFGPVVNRMNTSEKLVALTFDDGPNPGVTERVLAILKKHHVRALFFLVGERAQTHSDLVKMIVDQGHSVAVHSYKHTWFLPFHSKHFIGADLRQTKRIIKKLVPNMEQRPRYYRPPHGWRTPWMLRAISENSYTPVLWDVMTVDYIENYSSKKITDYVTKAVKPGSIIGLHDCVAEKPDLSRENMLEALPDIINNLQKQGYRFVRLQDVI